MTEKRLYELVPYDCQDGSCLMIHEKTRDSKLGALSLDHKSIGEAIVDELNNLAEENEQLKQKIKELDSENNKLWETCNHSLQFARQEDITITRDDKGHYKVYSKNVTPKDSPIISITAPSVFFNEYIINHIIEAIDKIPAVQEKEVDTDD